MILRRGLAAKYTLDARTASGARIETDTLVDAVYHIGPANNPLLTKALSGGGLTIAHSDDVGDGLLTVTIGNNELQYIGRTLHQLYITDCQGNNYPVKLRPDFLIVEA